jgi:hypothetical protein
MVEARVVNRVEEAQRSPSDVETVKSTLAAGPGAKTGTNGGLVGAGERGRDVSSTVAVTLVFTDLVGSSTRASARRLSKLPANLANAAHITSRFIASGGDKGEGHQASSYHTPDRRCDLMGPDLHPWGLAFNDPPTHIDD